MERRTVLVALVQTGSALVAAIVGVPTLIHLAWPAGRKRPGERWRSLGQLNDFDVGEVQEGVLAQPAGFRSKPIPHGVYVWRRSADDVVVFSRSCTDLGCPVTWDGGSHCFFCPCHGGIFQQDGTRMAGPPDRPLYRYATRIRDGLLEIDMSSVPPMA